MYRYQILRLCLIGLLLCTALYAQQTSVRGTVLNKEDGQALAYATVALYQGEDSSQVGGTLTDSVGIFFLQGLRPGIYRLKVSFWGFESIERLVELSRSEANLKLGVISLRPTQVLLEAIEITGKESKSYTKIDRQVYDAKQFQNAQGGSALDVVRNLPSIAVDDQGHISLRGSQGLRVMIDGRQIETDAVTILNQLAANQIEDIELLTTPSAQYDPDGQGGIINIKTKDGLADGMYLQINGRYGLPSLADYENKEPASRYGGDVTLNWKKGAWDLAAGVDYRRNDILGRREGYINTYQNGILTEFPSKGERSYDNIQYSGRLSVRYRPHPKHEIGFRFLAGDRTKYRTADILYLNQQRRRIADNAFLGPEFYWEQYKQNGTNSEQGTLIHSLTYFNENLRVREGDFLTGSIDYRWQFPSNIQFDLSALMERTILGGPTNNVSLAWPNVADTLQYQFNTNDNPLDGIRLRADFQKEGKQRSWKAGYQFRHLLHPGDFLYLDRDLENGTFEVNPAFTNQIELRRHIHGAYVQLAGQWKRLQYQAGLRLEYMDRKVSLAQPDTTYLYEIFQPFPSLNLSYKLDNTWTLQGGYSRRIERATTFKLTPFPEREHNEALVQGDAQLLPEFIHSTELGVNRHWGDHQFFVNGFYRGIQNVINRVNTVFNDTILNRYYTNAGRAQAIGIEMGSNFYPARWCRVSLGGNVYRYGIQGTLLGDEINTANTVFSFNMTTNFDLAPGLGLQAAFNYLSERVTAQGIDSRFYNPSLILSKTFGKGKYTASLQWLNMDLGLLQSNERSTIGFRDNFFLTTKYIYEVDQIFLNVSYRFNQRTEKPDFIKSEFGEKEF